VLVIPVLGKQKKPFKAVTGVRFDIENGMFGLLGPNGAGKSTLMRIICGILEPSYGQITINGIDLKEKREELQGLIGYLPQEFGMYENMTAWDFLSYIGILKKIYDKIKETTELNMFLRQFICTITAMKNRFFFGRYETAYRNRTNITASATYISC